MALSIIESKCLLVLKRLLKFCNLKFFFFFQAEDGIRDLYVTGVQTCALPIYAPGGMTQRVLGRHTPKRRRIERPEWAARCRQDQAAYVGGVAPVQALVQRVVLAVDRKNGDAVRSEERRVGKECRTRVASVPEK